MAWISVHEEIIGKKSRRLSKNLGCSQAEAIGILNIIWLWGLNNAEQSGEISDASLNDIADAIPAGMVSQGLDPITIINTMVETHWIDDINGTLYLHDWDHWQEQWYKCISRRAYDADQKRKKRSREKEEKEREKIETATRDIPVVPLPQSDKSILIYNEDIAQVMTMYLDKLNPNASPTSLDLLKSYTRDMTADVVILALNKALDEKKTSWSYIHSILKSYQNAGVKCLADAVELDVKWEARKNGGIQDIGGFDEKVGWNLPGATHL